MLSMESVIIGLFIISVFCLLLYGIYKVRQIPDFPLDIEDVDLCLYCPLDDNEKGTHRTPNGYYSCEGCRCDDAYEYYLECFYEENPRNVNR